MLTQRLDELRRVPVVPVSLRPKVKFRTNPPVDRPFDETDEDEPTELASGETSPADAVAVNDFGLKLFQKVRGDTTGNFTFSPASASSMLALAFPGAANETEAALLQLLAPDLDRTAAIERLSRWRRGLVASRPPIGATDTSGGNSGLRSKFARQSASRLLLANRIWTDTMCPTEPDWAATMKEQFASEIGQFDFGDVDGAVKEINDWGRKATRGRIPEIVDKEFLKTRGVFDGRTAFLLASALSLRAEWDSPFEKHKTVRANFHAPGLLQKVEMMHQLNQSSYAHLDGFKALEMSLGSGRWSMLFLLPDRKDANLDDLERQISLEFLAKVEKESERREVRIFLPRFRIESTLELTNALESLGIGPALSLRDADFSRMTNAPVYIDKVRQKTFLNVDEIGMEVAVATLGGAGFGGGFRDPNLEFRADHPFVYLLRDRSSGTIVMIGRFVGPDE
ncbi:MAG: hypothetical protein NT069_28260 [Planctomycetota bacterium]|nr:hypothetical protein [Planctomycetota bacterium]